MVCAESLDFNDALYLLHERGKAMQDAVPVGQGYMIAVLGSKIEEIKSLKTKKKKMIVFVRLQMIMQKVKLL